MSSLFIIGNGFDVAHDFNTKFDHFKEWFCDKLGENPSEEIVGIPEYQTNYRRLEEYDDQEMISFFYKLISDVVGDEWNNFESALALLDWAACVEESVEELKSVGELVGYYEDKQLMSIAEDLAGQLEEMSFLLKDNMFQSWVKQIDIENPSNISQDLKFIIENNKCYFLNFNYTDTLQLHYGVKNVCHIHGRSSANEELIVGHSGQNEMLNKAEDEKPFYMLMASGCNYTIRKGYEKKVQQIYNKNLDFFEMLADVTDVYIHGFSFSDVDMYYFKKIFQREDIKSAVIHLHSYRKEDWNNYKAKLIDLGATADNIDKFRFTELSDVEIIN